MESIWLVGQDDLCSIFGIQSRLLQEGNVETIENRRSMIRRLWSRKENRNINLLKSSTDTHCVWLLPRAWINSGTSLINIGKGFQDASWSGKVYSFWQDTQLHCFNGFTSSRLNPTQTGHNNHWNRHKGGYWGICKVRIKETNIETSCTRSRTGGNRSLWATRWRTSNRPSQH